MAGLALRNTQTYAPRMTRKPTTRLGPADWLDAGLAALTDTGPEALKAEPLAVRLGVSKGSFYWHFRDVPAFHEALLAGWETGAVSGLTGSIADETAPAARLRALAQSLAGSGLSPAEPAIRSWAQGHAGARYAIARVDEARLTLLQELLAETGIGNPEMARILYAACVGMGILGRTAPEERGDAIGSLVDLVLALR